MATNDTTYQSPAYTKFADKEIAVDYIYWEDWLKRWEDLRNPAEMISWLHIIFDVRAEIPHSVSTSNYVRINRDRILLCLDIAKECWKHRGMDDAPPNWEAVGSREVILKSISLLATNWFNIGSGKDDELISWFRNKGCFLINEEIIPEILAMFKEGQYSGYRIPRAIKEHEKVILKKFLSFLVLMPWSREWTSEEVLTESQRDYLRLMEPEFIRILVDIGEINQLLSRRNFVSKNNLRTLRKLVFAPTFRGAKTASCLGEAIGLHFRDKAAETLLILEESIGFAEKLRRKLEHSRQKLWRLTDREEATKSELQEVEAAIAVAKRSGQVTARLESMRNHLIEEQRILAKRILMLRKHISEVSRY